jgi:hypothetical protein
MKKSWRLAASALLIVGSAHAQVSVIGPVTPGNIPVFNSTTVLKDSGVAGGTGGVATIPAAYPCSPPIDGAACVNSIFSPPLISAFNPGTPSVLCPINQNCTYSGNNVFPFNVLSPNLLNLGLNAQVPAGGAPYPGKTYALSFTSSGLTGSPITLSYTASNTPPSPPTDGAPDSTSSAVATHFCQTFNANATLHNPQTKMPIICDSITGGGSFNIQWSVQLGSTGSPTGPSDLVVKDASPVQTGGGLTSNTGGGGWNPTTGALGPDRLQLDFVETFWGRHIPNYNPVNGDSPICFALAGDGNAPTPNVGALGVMCSQISSAAAGNFSNNLFFMTWNSSVQNIQLGLLNGTALYGTGSLAPVGAYKGLGTMNIAGMAGVGGLYFDGVQFASNTGLTAPSGLVAGGTAAGSILTLKSTTNATPTASANVNFLAGPNTIFQVTPTTTAPVNYLQMWAASTGNGPTIATAGSDTNINMFIGSKGTGWIQFSGFGAQSGAASLRLSSTALAAQNGIQIVGVPSGSAPLIQVEDLGGTGNANIGMILQTIGTSGLTVSSASGTGTFFTAIPSSGTTANFLQAQGALTTAPPILSAQGSDTNISINLVPKGTGVVQVNGTQIATANLADVTGVTNWTPGIAFGGGTTGITYTAQLGRYVKIGKVVVADFDITLSAKGTSTGAATITGLPFSSDLNMTATGSMGFYNNVTWAAVPVVLSLATNSTAVNIEHQTTTTILTEADTAFTNTSRIVGTISYISQ